MDHQFVDNAYYFAAGAHAAVGQVRKYSGNAYIVHPIEVCNILYAWFEFNENDKLNQEMVAATFLHDVVEDTSVTLDQIKSTFGQKTHDIVKYLTNISKKEDGNRAKRKEIDRNHLFSCPESIQYEVFNIKIADMISNVPDIIKNDPQFANKYVAEKKVIVDQMKGNRHVNADMLEHLEKIINNYLESKQ